MKKNVVMERPCASDKLIAVNCRRMLHTRSQSMMLLLNMFF